MQRQITQELLAWKKRSGTKPLILKGVRQCGNPWLLKQFGKEHFTDTAYFNFEGNTSLHNVFAATSTPTASSPEQLSLSLTKSSSALCRPFPWEKSGSFPFTP